MRKMLLSFKPEVYEKIKTGKKKFEHRRNFPDEPIMAYMYVSAPVKAITGILYLGKRHLLSNWHEEFKDDKDAVARIEKYQESYRYAMEIDEFQETGLAICVFHTVGFRIRALLMRKRHCVQSYLIVLIEVHRSN